VCLKRDKTTAWIVLVRTVVRGTPLEIKMAEPLYRMSLETMEREGRLTQYDTRLSCSKGP